MNWPIAPEKCHRTTSWNAELWPQNSNSAITRSKTGGFEWFQYKLSTGNL